MPWISAHGHMNSWGMDAYVGITEPGYTYSTSDLRSQMPSMVDVEGPDLGVYQNMGGTIGKGGYWHRLRRFGLIGPPVLARDALSVLALVDEEAGLRLDRSEQCQAYQGGACHQRRT